MLNRAIAGMAVAATAATVCGQVTVYDAGGFEGFMLGALHGQNGWSGIVDGTAFGGAGDPNGNPPEIVDFAGNRVLQLSADIPRDPSGEGNYRRQSIAAYSFGADLAAAGWDSVTISFDVYAVPGNFQNFYWWAGTTSRFGQTYNDGQWIRGFHEGPVVPGGTHAAGEWHTVSLTWDFINGTRRAVVDGVDQGVIAGLDLAGGLSEFSIRMVTDNRPGGPAGLGYVDNFLVTAVPTPSAALPLAAGACLAARRRRR